MNNDTQSWWPLRDELYLLQRKLLIVVVQKLESHDLRNLANVLLTAGLYDKLAMYSVDSKKIAGELIQL